MYYQRPRRTITRRVIEARPDRELRGMLEDVVEEGTGRGADPGFDVAGKTGTSQDSRDAWFIGFSDDVVGAVWLGNDDNTPMAGVTGGSVPAQIWRDVMASAQPRHDGNESFLGIENYGSFGGLMNRLLGASPDPGETTNTNIDWNTRRPPASEEPHTENSNYND